MQSKLGLCAALLLVATPVWSQSGPSRAQPGGPEIYKDWVVGCDNGLSCQAVGLMAETGDLGAGGEISITREPGGNDAPTLTFTFEVASQSTLSIVVDDRVVATTQPEEEGAELEGKVALAVVRALAQGRKLEIRQGDTVVAEPSLSGASAALRYMDARQNRAGGASALVALGPKPASAVPAAPAVPTVAIARPIAGEPPELTAAEQQRAAEFAGCEAEEPEDSTQETTLYPLDAQRTLVLLPCGSGAYNFSSAVLLVRGKPGSRQFSHPGFDDEQAPAKGEARLVTNADWDAATSSLSEYHKGRGLGDCGVSSTYAWDGSRMRLTYRAVMPECRGSQEMIVIWQAETK